jgi:hypothetical protein
MRGMDEDDDTVTGVLAGVNMTRHSSFMGPIAGVGSFIVRLPDGRELSAIMDLTPLKHSWMVRTFEIGSTVRLKLGTVLESIRIIEIQEPA